MSGSPAPTPPADWAPALGPPVPTRVTFLEMTAPPPALRAPPPAARHAILRVEQVPLAYYRWLYHRIGSAWSWVDRKRWDDARLGALLHDPGYNLSVLYLRGAPAGLFELDQRDPKDINLGLFGLMPEVLGQRLGPWLLDQALDSAWALCPHRLRVDTCSLDHPRALALYQRLGFTPYATIEKLTWPVAPGTLGPPDQGDALS